MQTANPEPTDVDLITVPSRHRALDKETVERLAKSIAEIGLHTPITVHSVNDGERLDLVAGHHRLAAVKKLGWPKIPCFVIEGDELEAQMWEIAENLHRAELTALERDQHVARWLELSEARVSAQVGPKSKKGRPQGGVRAAAREIGVSRQDAGRAVKVASLTPEAKEAARETGLDDNRSALLQAAAKPAKEQVTYLQDFAERKKQHVQQDVKQQAADELAEIFLEYIPADVIGMVKANLIAAGCQIVANAIAKKAA